MRHGPGKAARALLATAALLAIGLPAAHAAPASAVDASNDISSTADRGYGARSTLQPVAPPPVVGAQGVAVADPTLSRPPVTPCVVPLFDGVTFTDFSPRPFNYTPPAGCKGPYAKVVLEVDFSVNAGNQFDRTGSLAIGGVNLYFGSTQEPTGTVAPTWHIERDVTEYASLLATPQTGRIDIDNPVDDFYTGIIRGNGRLKFYPARGAVPASPNVADSVISLGTTGRPVFLASGTDKLQRSVMLPGDVTQAYLDVYAQNQSSDEFFWNCVPDALVSVVNGCGGGTFREAWITIDGQPAGVSPVFPWVFTGGINPTFWQPTPAIQTLNFVPYRVDLTPFAALLSNGQPHTVAVQVAGAQSGFAVTANLLVYRDKKRRATRGGLLENTLAAQQPGGETSTNALTTGEGVLVGTIDMKAGRKFAITGYIDTPKGRVTTRIVQQLAFSNQKRFNNQGTLNSREVTQLTTLQSETTIRNEKRRSGERDDDASRQDARAAWVSDGDATVTRQSLRLPLTLSNILDLGAFSSSNTFTQAYERSTERFQDKRLAYRSATSNAMTSGTGFKLNDDGTFSNPIGSTHAVRYSDSLGSCFDRRLTTTNNALSAVQEGSNCPQGNLIDWRALPDGAPEQGVFEWLSR